MSSAGFDPHAALRERLLERAAQLRAEVQAHRDGLAEPAGDTANAFIAGNEGAVADADDEREVALLTRAQRELDEVDAALRRFDAGRYGDCQRCGEPIGLQRLQARPEARLCVGCQLAVEQRQRGAAPPPAGRT